MGTSVVSDIHLRNGECAEREFFKRFSGNPLARNSQTIVFLGDIFDLLFGSHPEYLTQYSFFFDFIHRLVSEGRSIHYVEGNHDLHLESLFVRFFCERNLNHDKFHYHKGGFFQKINGRNVYFSHGDEMDTTDRYYQYYRNAIGSGLARLLTETFLTHSFVERIGHQASQKSRLRNRHKYSDETLDTVVREKIRQCVEKQWKTIRFDLLVCGHTHIKDYYQSSQGFLYVNNGYAPRENTFIHISDHGEAAFLAV